MVKDAGYRKAKYERKRKTSMPVAYKEAMESEEIRVDNMARRAELDALVAGILTNRNVAGPARIAYHNFARAVDRAKREGTLTESKIRGLKTYFIEGYGCREEILDEIIKAMTGAEAAPA